MGRLMNTRQLRHFLAVLDLGSLSAAAEVVHLSLPALSRSLRSLEDELRVPLFDRQDRRLRPTPYALLYAERARRIVFDEKEGARSLALMHAGELGSLHFGMGSSIEDMVGEGAHALVYQSGKRVGLTLGRAVDNERGHQRHNAGGEQGFASHAGSDAVRGWEVTGNLGENYECYILIVN